MAVTATPYANFALGLGLGKFNLTTDTYKIMLATSAYTPVVATHTFVSAVVGQIAGTGYTQGGATLTGVTWAYDPLNVRCTMMANPVTWTGADFTARLAVIYQYTGDVNTGRLVGFMDFGVDKTYASEDAQMSFPAGVVRIKLGA